MPELPDVEAFRRYLDEHAAGQRIERVEVADTDVLRNTSPQGLGRAVSGRRFAAPDRHGKWLLARLERGDAAPTVVMHFGHFGMTGYLTWAGRGDDAGRGDEAGRHEHDRLVFVCEDGELRFNLMRKFGGVWLARVGQEVTDVTGELGPDAADLSRDALAEVLDGRRGGLKSALMDQELVAGIGNIVADEVLWQARLHPRKKVSALDDDGLDRLHDAVRHVHRQNATMARQNGARTAARQNGAAVRRRPGRVRRRRGPPCRGRRGRGAGA